MYVGGDGGNDDVDVDMEMDVSEANILGSKTRISRGIQGPEILVFHILMIQSILELDILNESSDLPTKIDPQKTHFGQKRIDHFIPL